MTYFLTYATAFLEFICIYTIIHLFTEKKLLPNATDIFFCLFIVILLKSIPNEYNAFSLILGQLCYIIYVLASTSGKLFQSMLLYILTACVLLIAQFIMVFMMALLGITSPIPSSIIGSFGTLALILLFFYFTPIRKLYDIVVNASKLLQVILLNTYLIFFSVLLIFRSDQLQIYHNPALLFTIITFLLATNAGILYYDLKLQSQEQEMKSYQKNIPIYESLISDIRSSQHEYSNRLQALSTLPFTCTDYDSLCTALIKYTKEYSHSLHGYSLLQTNMPLLSASLYNLMNKAAKNDITVHFDVVSSTLKSSVPEYILSDMACILLQNAVEECKENDFIYVFIESTDGTMKFEVRNPSAVYYAHGELLNFFNKGVSTKSPETNHGIGLYYLKKMIDKYNGTIGADCVCYNNEIWTVFKFQV